MTTMQAETFQATIDGREFQFFPLALKPARKLFDQLVRRFGPALADGLIALEGEVDEQAAIGALGAALKQAFLEVDASFHEELVKLLSAKSQIKNDTGDWVPLNDDWQQLAFATHMLLELRWIWFCLSSQYADFLEPVQQAAARAMRPSPTATASGSPSISQTGSIGRSTE